MRIDNTRDERAKRARENKLRAGLVSRALYLPAQTVADLQAAFPGERGGIDWTRAANAALSASTGQTIPADALDQLRAAFPDQGAAYGVDWAEAAKVATMTAERRRGDKERQRRCRERRKAGKDQAAPTS